MNYADGVQDVLIRKINKAEQGVTQLKLDYCRFIFGLTHRTPVKVGDVVYRIVSVDVDSMERQEDGSLSRPRLSGVPFDTPGTVEAVNLDRSWQAVTTSLAGNDAD